jgi:hypothetical protein
MDPVHGSVRRPKRFAGALVHLKLSEGAGAGIALLSPLSGRNATC